MQNCCKYVNGFPVVMYSFELGPIRPPSEAKSILLRLTRNCPWNRCAFCPVYKKEKFSHRPVEEVKQDIDSMARIADAIRAAAAENGVHSIESDVFRIIKKMNPGDEFREQDIRQVAFWMYYGMKSLFLQDADSLVLKTERVVEILNYMLKTFPTIERVTTYARAKTVSKKTSEEMKDLAGAGLNRVHIGMESGSDYVLSMVNKGVTQAEQVEAGQKVMAAGCELSEYYMPGLGGMDLLKENAVESARVLNAVNPTFIRIRSVIPVPGTPLFEMMSRGEWTPPGELDKVEELRMFITELNGITSTVKSDHIMNLLGDVEGKLPEDRELMLDRIDRFLVMDHEDRESFIVGRRLNRFHSLDEFRRDPEVERVRAEIRNRFTSLDEGILQILWNFI